MEVYLFTIFILASFSFFQITTENYRDSNQLIKFFGITSFCILVIQMGLRWETGTDWEPYYDHFNSFTNQKYWREINEMEIGYGFFVYLFNNFFGNYSIFLLVNAVIFYWLTFRAIRFFSPYSILGFLLFYCFSIGLWGSNRQLLSLSIGLVSLEFLYKKKLIYYFVLVFIAYLFHSSSLLFLPFFFLNKELSFKNIFIILLVSFVIGYTGLPVKIFSLAGGINEMATNKAEIYLNQANENLASVRLSLFGLLKRLFFLLIFLYNRDKISKLFPKYNLLLNGYVLSLAFYFIFSQSLLVMISRGSLYFNAMEPLLLSFQLVLLKDKKYRLIGFLILLIFAFISFKQSISAYPELFDPYKGIFYNEHFNRVVF